MNLRREKYKNNRLAGMNQMNAAVAAGYARSTALHKSKRIEKVVISSILDELERAGLTDKKQAEALAKLAYDTDPKISLAAWRHISELKKQTKTDVSIDQSKHYTRVEYQFKEGENNGNRERS